MKCACCSKKQAEFYVTAGNLIKVVCPPCIWAGKAPRDFKLIPKRVERRRR